MDSSMFDSATSTSSLYDTTTSTLSPQKRLPDLLQYVGERCLQREQVGLLQLAAARVVTFVCEMRLVNTSASRENGGCGLLLKKRVLPALLRLSRPQFAFQERYEALLILSMRTYSSFCFP